MPLELKIDHAVYAVDRETQTYWFLRRNPQWKTLAPQENQRNKELIRGYTRVYRDGRVKVYPRSG